MRHVLALLVVCCGISAPTVASQAPGGAATRATAVRACSILTKDLVAPFTQNKKVLDAIPPEEESLAGSGSACEWGIVRLQLYPIARGAKPNRTAPGKEFQPVSGAGEAAYFRNNRNNYAELVVWTATYNFTLQVSVPTGSTADAIKPDTIALANTIIAKLR
jgi:hypothetical protein